MAREAPNDEQVDLPNGELSTCGLTLPAGQRGRDFCRPLSVSSMILAPMAAMFGAQRVWDHLSAGPSIAELDEPGGPRISELTDDGVLVVHLAGPISKYGKVAGRTSSVQVRGILRKAADNPQVRGIILIVDSPGGTVAGTDALAADVAMVGKRKPVWASVADLCTDAAFWVGSQATRLVAQPASLVGGIGSYGVLADSSKGASDLGIQVHVVRPAQGAEFKGMGVDGTTITDAHLAEVRRIVSGFHQSFVAAVARGRRMSVEAVSRLADGRVHPAAEAVGLGLIDAVETFDATLRKMREQIGGSSGDPPPKRATVGALTVREPTMATRPATFGELRAAMPKAPSELLAECIKQGRSICEARDRYVWWLGCQTRAAEARKLNAEAAIRRMDLRHEMLASRSPSAPGSVVALVTRFLMQRLDYSDGQAYVWASHYTSCPEDQERMEDELLAELAERERRYE